jgi:hypothetical protein
MLTLIFAVLAMVVVGAWFVQRRRRREFEAEVGDDQIGDEWRV